MFLHVIFSSCKYFPFSVIPISSIPEIQENLGHAVNNLVKYFYKPEKEVSHVTIATKSNNLSYIFIEFFDKVFY